jgi:hypothetical protein
MIRRYNGMKIKKIMSFIKVEYIINLSNLHRSGDLAYPSTYAATGVATEMVPLQSKVREQLH